MSRFNGSLLWTQRECGAWVGRRRAKPLVIAAEKMHTYVIVGVSPLTQEEVRMACEIRAFIALCNNIPSCIHMAHLCGYVLSCLVDIIRGNCCIDIHSLFRLVLY